MMDILPGALLPTSRLYSLTKLEYRAMEKYTKDSLAHLPPPLRAVFFFVEKKDKTL